MSGWTDAQLLGAAGVPTVLYGPGAGPEPGEGGIGLAHSALEYASVRSARSCARVLAAAAERLCGG
jgi:acetylornithine deacetylase/succinyl-diaminopimelate desuccinylase-like protein